MKFNNLHVHIITFFSLKLPERDHFKGSSALNLKSAMTVKPA